MLTSIGRRFGVLMLALTVASAIGCQPKTQRLNLEIKRHAKLRDRGVEVHLVGLNEMDLEEWHDNEAGAYWQTSNDLRKNAQDRGLIRRITAFRPNGDLGPTWVRANDPIWATWKMNQAMHVFIYAQGVAVDGAQAGPSQVLKQFPIDSHSYGNGDRVTIEIMPSQITVRPPPKLKD